MPPPFHYPRSLSEILPKVNSSVFERTHLLLGKIITGWTHIVGPDLRPHTLPLEIKLNRKTKCASLVLGVRPAYALELSYQKSLLLERINVFLGYIGIEDIKLIQYNNMEIIKPSIQKIPSLSPQKLAEIEKTIASIHEKDLQTALKNFGASLAARTK